MWGGRLAEWLRCLFLRGPGFESWVLGPVSCSCRHEEAAGGTPSNWVPTACVGGQAAIPAPGISCRPGVACVGIQGSEPTGQSSLYLSNTGRNQYKDKCQTFLAGGRPTFVIALGLSWAPLPRFLNAVIAMGVGLAVPLCISQMGWKKPP